MDGYEHQTKNFISTKIFKIVFSFSLLKPKSEDGEEEINYFKHLPRITNKRQQDNDYQGKSNFTLYNCRWKSPALTSEVWKKSNFFNEIQVEKKSH